MEYLQKVLGLKLTYINDDIKHIPNFVGTRYVLRNVLLDRQKAVFIYPKTELEQIETLKKHISKIKSIVNLPVVMILDEITYRQKEYLLREKIPFVVNNKQIYLPFMLSLYAGRESKAKLITKVNRIAFENVIDSMNLGSVIYPKLITADLILQYVRAMQNSLGSNVETLYKIVANRAEALEFRVGNDAPMIGIP